MSDNLGCNVPKNTPLIMRVTGFSFIRNAIRYDYPIVEAVRSVLPLCDAFVLAVGKSEDETLQLIHDMGEERIRILETVWDDSLRQGGRVLAEETNKALAAIPADTDWAFYIQGDEVLHEDGIPAVRRAMRTHLADGGVDGLLFDYLHFYGSYQYVGESRRWYKHEVRVVRPHIGVYSYQDAMGFRKGDNKKLRVKPANARIHHYGWVKPPYIQQRKQESFNKLWHSDAKVASMVEAREEYDYLKNIDSLAPFDGTHPTAMRARVQAQDWAFHYDPSMKRLSTKERAKRFAERLTGREWGAYRNYHLI